jgi:uncharacterized protein (TIGR00369 family)
MTGLELLEKLANGELPPAPIAQTLGFEIAEIGYGHASFQLDPGEHLYNPLGTVHGGVIATLLDSAMGCAVHSTLEEGRSYTTLELKVNYVGVVTRDSGRVVASGSVVHRGRSTATAEGRLLAQGDDRLLAHATCTCLVM